MSGKKILVEKTPKNVIHWKLILKCWPRTKVIFLLRHPASIAESWQERGKGWTKEDSVDYVLQYMKAVNEARAKLRHKSITLRYEDLINDPSGNIKRVCEFIGVDYEPEMLNYGAYVGNKDRYNKAMDLGDRSDKIRLGVIQEGRKLPATKDIPTPLLDVCKAWGYTEVQ